MPPKVKIRNVKKNFMSISYRKKHYFCDELKANLNDNFLKSKNEYINLILCKIFTLTEIFKLIQSNFYCTFNVHIQYQRWQLRTMKLFSNTEFLGTTLSFNYLSEINSSEQCFNFSPFHFRREEHILVLVCIFCLFPDKRERKVENQSHSYSASFREAQES